MADSNETKASAELPEASKLQRDPRFDTIRSLRGANLSAALEDDPEFREAQQTRRFERLARMFVERHRSAFRLQDPASELSVLSKITDELGLTHVRFEQRYAGLRVADAQLIVHLDAEGRVTGAGGGYRPTPTQLQTTPALSIDDAHAAAAQEVGIDSCSACPTELMIFAPNDGDPRLAYRVDTAAKLQRWQLMVAADDGEILRKLPTALQGTVPGAIGRH